jgi:hypothetical protein
MPVPEMTIYETRLRGARNRLRDALAHLDDRGGYGPISNAEIIETLNKIIEAVNVLLLPTSAVPPVESKTETTEEV